jgi:hypothetical protein
MNQFVFTSQAKKVLGAFMGLGVLCMLLTFFVADDVLHSRFWSNFLHNSVFFTGIAFISLFIISAFTTAWAGWYTQIKRIWEAYSLFMIPGLLLMLVIIAGIWLHGHHLYHWTDAAALEEDEILAHKSSFLNPVWYTLGSLIIVGIWIFFAKRMRSLSIDEDQSGDNSYQHHKKYRIWSAAFLPVAGFSSAAIVWLWVMSVDAHWYSTLFAWYTAVSWFVAAMALTIITVSFLKSLGHLEGITGEHLHDLGKFLFAFSIFWTYLWFSQFMLIWYGNVGEETVYFQERQENYPVLFYGNLFINFVLPFFVLMRNDTKRKYGTLIFVSILVFFGHWWDFFQMIKPGVLHTTHEALSHLSTAVDHGGGDHHGSSAVAGFTLPGLLEIGTMLGFLAGFIYVVFNHLSKASLVPKNDPYLAESVHHHV